eukprot:34437_1
MHGITNNGFVSQIYIIKGHIYGIEKFITWFLQRTRSLLLFTSLCTIFVNSNAILVRGLHYSTHLIRGNGQKWIFLSTSAVVRSSAHTVMEQGQKQRLEMDKEVTNWKKGKKMTFVKDLDVLEISGIYV